MIASTRKLAAETREIVGRPATGTTPIRHIRIPDDEWDDLHKLAGKENVRVLRQLIRWYLRRPGSKLPVRPTAEDVANVLSAASDDE